MSAGIARIRHRRRRLRLREEVSNRNDADETEKREIQDGASSPMVSTIRSALTPALSAVRTIRLRVANIFGKLSVSSRAAAVARAGTPLPAREIHVDDRSDSITYQIAFAMIRSGTSRADLKHARFSFSMRRAILHVSTGSQQTICSTVERRRRERENL